MAIKHFPVVRFTSTVLEIQRLATVCRDTLNGMTK